MTQTRLKHIDIKYHFIREHIQKKHIKVEYCKTDLMLADLLTKALPKDRFESLRSYMGLAPVPGGSIGN